jgi:MerR family transcriptional regulator, light-induced transcriptional regulator
MSEKPDEDAQSDSTLNRASAPGGHRSGAVARMLRMPVATLRVWERRYGVTQAATSASGQRLYSAEDVRRLALLKQLNDLGHAIGSLARLSMDELRQVAITHAGALAARAVDVPQPVTRQAFPLEVASASPRVAPAWRVVVIGSALADRLRGPDLLRWLSRPVHLLGPFADAAQAAAALQGEVPDAVLVHQPSLQDDWLVQLQTSAPLLAACPKAVLYRYAAERTCAMLAEAGTALMREPQNDTVLGQWLNVTLLNLAAHREPASRLPDPSAPLPPRRWDDAALADFAGLSSTIACECPRHVAELLVQLSHFEDYSAQCRQLSAGDAELHAYLQHVAATSRARFESALELVALHEGLLLPSSTPP